jgi:hypothetical protein
METIGLPEVTVGLVPGGGGTQLALRRLGPGRAADLVLTGRRVGAEEAERIGLVDRRVPLGDDRRVALDLAAQITANSPVAVRAAKRALRHGWGCRWSPGSTSRTRPGEPPRCRPTVVRASPPSPPSAPRPGRPAEHRADRLSTAPTG